MAGPYTATCAISDGMQAQLLAIAHSPLVRKKSGHLPDGRMPNALSQRREFDQLCGQLCEGMSHRAAVARFVARVPAIAAAAFTATPCADNGNTEGPQGQWSEMGASKHFERGSPPKAVSGGARV